MRFSLSERRHLPALFLSHSKVAFPVTAYRYLSKFEKEGLVYDETAAHTLAEVRNGYYNPPFSLRGKYVLDIGACCGETAWYFIRCLGAEKVYCIESDSKRIAVLHENRRRSGLNFDIVGEPFKLEHLTLRHDYVKCDIEGQEVLLLDYLSHGHTLGPCVVEVHSTDIRIGFEGYGFHIIDTPHRFHEEQWIMNNFGSDRH